MLIPICTTAKTRRCPAVVLLLVAANVIVFLATRHDLNTVAREWGYVAAGPSAGTVGETASGSVRLLTYAFLHGGWGHLIGNLWMLVVFGRPLEHRLGALRFLLVYVLLGAIAAAVHGRLCAGDMRPVVGASGAISGLLGCFLVLEARGRILSVVFLGLFSFVAEVPVFFFVGIWFLLQLEAVHSMLLDPAAVSNVAWWAHLGGFAGGVLLAGLKWLISSRTAWGDTTDAGEGNTPQRRTTIRSNWRHVQ